MRLPLAALLVGSLLLAGCIQVPADVRPAGQDFSAQDEAAFERIRALMADVPCEAPVSASETSANILELGALAFPEEGAVGEVDVRGNLMLVARYQAGGLHVVNISDPAAPAVLGTLDVPDTGALDVKWLPKGDGAVIGARGQLILVDLADVAAPRVAFTYEYANDGLSGQAHMVTTHEIAGNEWVFVATQTSNQPLLVFERAGWNLTFVTQFSQVPLLHTLPLGNHDITIIEDEMLGGKHVMYVADGLAGWYAADVDDPSKPVKIGGSLSLEPGPGYTHTVRVAFMDGKRIVVTMAEVGVNTLKVYDATDLEKPVLLGRWNADAARPHLPQHNIQIVADMLYLAHYTEGVYVFNLTGVAKSAPVLGSLALTPVAHYAVAQKQDGGALGFANVWEVVLKDGIVYANDMQLGLVALGFGCIAPGDPAQSGTQ